MIAWNGFLAQPNANGSPSRIRILFKTVTVVLSAAAGKRQTHLVQSKDKNKYDEKGEISGDAGRALLTACLLKS
jgi:hypothetical protein